MPKKLIIANWKMNPESQTEARAIAVAARDASKKVKGVTVVACPPVVYLPELSRELGKGPAAQRLILGAQNCYFEKSGPHTGEVSPTMLKTVGASYVILGHSERRKEGETDALIQKKVIAALKAGLTVVICIGESSRDEHGEYLQVIESQIKSAIPFLPRKQLDNIVLAYEPLWAIGAGAAGAATPEDVFSTTIFIRKVLTEITSKDLALTMPIVYGGSVDALNAAPMIAGGGVQGLLVGRESLHPKGFAALLVAVAAVK